MAIIPKVGSGGEKFDITNGVREQYAAVGEDIEKHTFVEYVEIGPISSEITASNDGGYPVVDFEDETDIILRVNADLTGSYIVCVIRRSGDSFVASNWINTAMAFVVVGRLDANRWLLRTLNEQTGTLKVLKISGTTLSVGTALAYSGLSGIGILGPNSVVGVINHREGSSGYNEPAYSEAMVYNINDTVITAGSKVTIFTANRSWRDDAPELKLIYPTHDNGGIICLLHGPTYSDAIYGIHVTISGTSITAGASLNSVYADDIAEWSPMDKNSFILRENPDDARVVMYTVRTFSTNTLAASNANGPSVSCDFYNLDSSKVFAAFALSNRINIYLYERSGNSLPAPITFSDPTSYTGVAVDDIISLGNNRYRIFYTTSNKAGIMDIYYDPLEFTLTKVKSVQNKSALTSIAYIGQANNVGYFADAINNRSVIGNPATDDVSLFEVSDNYPPPDPASIPIKTKLVFTKNCIWSVYGDYAASQGYYFIRGINVNSKNTVYAANYSADYQYSQSGPKILKLIATSGGITFVASVIASSSVAHVLSKGFVMDDNGNVSIPGTGVQKSTTKIEGVTEEKIFQGNLGNVLVLDTEE